MAEQTMMKYQIFELLMKQNIFLSIDDVLNQVDKIYQRLNK